VNIVFAMSFMHSIVLERRKFGPLGFTVPYEYNYGDMDASLGFIERHMNFCQANNVKESWTAIKYLTCEVQYGGRITDNMDREMFNTYGELWLTEKVFTKGYNFNAASEWPYKIPETVEHAKILQYIDTMPEKDSPTIFGLNVSADLTYRLNESILLMNTLIDVQPREAGGGSGLSREDQVKQKIETDFLKNLPPSFDKIETEKQILSFKAPLGLVAPRDGRDKQLPLSVFLRQELDSMQRILDIARSMMQEMIKAIDGEVVMTPDLVVAIESMYNNRVPKQWVYDATGVEIAWISPSLGAWINGLHSRYRQLRLWLEKDRPFSFWLTGFQRPQAFLTAVRQEVARQQRSKNNDAAHAERWALDNVDYYTIVQKEEIKSADGSLEGKSLKPPVEGVFIHGLFIEGAQWNKQGYLEESEAKDLKALFKDFPVMHVTAESTKKDENERQPQGGKGKESLEQLRKTHYNCPVYKYKTRTDKYLIFRCLLKPTADLDAKNFVIEPKINWKLKGVALMCNKE
jgi:dynein heavy chain, axonemal